MNSLLFSNIMRFITVVLVQVLICNQLNFLGSINPYIYILFLLLYPIGIDRMGFLFIAFNLGMIMDLFLDSGGAHAAASLCIAYLRPIFLKFSFAAVLTTILCFISYHLFVRKTFIGKLLNGRKYE